MLLNAAALFLLLSFTGSTCAGTLPRVAVFDFELIDNSLDGSIYGTTDAEKDRLQRTAEQLRKALEDSGRYELAGIGPVAEAARGANLQACGGCDGDFAKQIGASFSITGTVQKVSNLILNISLYVRDVHSGNVIRSMSADMRGNTDESWARAMNWLIKNRLFPSNFEQTTDNSVQ
jgi:Protein of unknown function (DUF2380)